MEQKIKMTWYEKLMRGKVQHYNPKKYWKRRSRVINYRGGILEKVICTWYLYLIKKDDAFNNASFGTHLGKGATFSDIPRTPHGINGIIVSHNAVIGKHCCIYHQVTIGEADENVDNAPTIGDNVFIGAGAKIIGKIIIGNNVKIGANCVITFDVPENSTVVMEKAKIIAK